MIRSAALLLLALAACAAPDPAPKPTIAPASAPAAEPKVVREALPSTVPADDWQSTPAPQPVAGLTLRADGPVPGEDPALAIDADEPVGLAAEPPQRSTPGLAPLPPECGDRGIVGTNELCLGPRPIGTE
ncbi:hypothetical protein LNKW23_34450 [Paralimibaculum aggregatum]|uniref:Uncharacterized protein n=1 Tax=Paralimibaculum aggregatum TaxID=3036245 RepID=A0ABQ6LPH2_9RHOB|nr:hypothetical protein [Limibaculum sp. NKW23]GMG84230.1 hypothetical protein LNKW23_34450 [Limibaculum sp. NKW23]